MGHRWAKEEGLESILQVTGIMNIIEFQGKHSAWLVEQMLGGCEMLTSLELLKLGLLPHHLVKVAYGISPLSGLLRTSEVALVPLPPAESCRTGYIHTHLIGLKV